MKMGLMKNIFITGVSSGIGYQLSKIYLERGYRVFGVSRRAVDLKKLTHFQLDISEEKRVVDTLSEIKDLEFDLVILNAGVLDKIAPLSESSIREIERVMRVNVWANKTLLDLFTDVKQVVAISSGASVNGSKGWNSYSLSKATLNMLIKLYASERVDTHFTALAPGVITTPMLNSILEESDREEFPSIKRLAEVDKLSPEESAKTLYKLFPKLLSYKSGEFLDIRNL
jgi:benzil reductase ((S)-benzoin forming)